MFKRRTSRVRQRRQVKVLRASVMSPRIFWFDFRRAMYSFFRWAMIAAILAAIGWGVWAGVERGLLKNDEFRLQKLVLNDNAAIDEIRLLEVAGIDLNGSLFDCNPDAIRATLVALPEISRATVVREFPGDLVVHVDVREPHVWVACEGLGIGARDVQTGLLVDRVGRIFPCPKGLRQQAMELPVMELRDPEPGLIPGGTILHSDFDRLMRLYRVIEEKVPEAENWVDTIHLHKSWGCVLTTRDGIEATFGHDDLERQMSDLLAAVDHALEKGDRIATISLVGRRNLPVTFHGTTAPRAIIVSEPVAEPAAETDLHQLLER